MSLGLVPSLLYMAAITEPPTLLCFCSSESAEIVQIAKYK